MKLSFQNLPAVFKRIYIILFDWKKKMDMNQLYGKNANPWGRSETIAQVAAATSLLYGRHYERCLDVGSGLGFFSEAVSGFCDEVIAIDISKIAINRARARLGSHSNIKFVSSNIRTWQTEAKFDLIILADVLYYLGDEIMSEAFRVILLKINSILHREGNILLTHFLAPWRDQEKFERWYLHVFKEMNFTIEKREIFEKNNGLWIHVVLQKTK